jgi:hypothetical protein
MDLAGVYFCVWSVRWQLSERGDLSCAAGEILGFSAISVSGV